MRRGQVNPTARFRAMWHITCKKTILDLCYVLKSNENKYLFLQIPNFIDISIIFLILINFSLLFILLGTIRTTKGEARDVSNWLTETQLSSRISESATLGRDCTTPKGHIPEMISILFSSLSYDQIGNFYLLNRPWRICGGAFFSNDIVL